MLIMPEAEELTRMLPAMVEQEAKAVASAAELMVAVDWEHTDAVDWPTARVAKVAAAKATESFWVNMLMSIML
jgi:hypothetical protein